MSQLAFKHVLKYFYILSTNLDLNKYKYKIQQNQQIQNFCQSNQLKIKLFLELIHFQEDGNLINNWGWDQTIVTYSLLSQQVCSLNLDKKLWVTYQLPPLQFDDSHSCWHGALMYSNCNRVKKTLEKVWIISKIRNKT